MSKIETSIKCIECGNKLLDTVYKELIKYNNSRDNLSDFEKETYNSILGSQLALVCEYYFKGLLIPNLKVSIPEELKSKISSLSEEQELMIIVSDEDKIKADPILSTLDKKELRLLLNENSLKSFSHNLSSLFGTETLTENKEINLPSHIRYFIMNEMKSRLNDPEAKTFEEKHAFREYIRTPIQRTEGIKRIEIGDRIIDEKITDTSVSDAFPKGRYGIFNGFETNIDFLSGLAFSLRHAIKHQYINMIEVFKNQDDPFGRFIYPDSNTFINVRSTYGETTEYEMVPEIYDDLFGTRIVWNASRTIPTKEEQKQLEVLNKYLNNPRIARSKIFLDANSSNIEFVQDGKTKNLELIDGELLETVPSDPKEKNL